MLATKKILIPKALAPFEEPSQREETLEESYNSVLFELINDKYSDHTVVLATRLGIKIPDKERLRIYQTRFSLIEHFYRETIYSLRKGETLSLQEIRKDAETNKGFSSFEISYLLERLKQSSLAFKIKEQGFLADLKQGSDTELKSKLYATRLGHDLFSGAISQNMIDVFIKTIKAGGDQESIVRNIKLRASIPEIYIMGVLNDLENEGKLKKTRQSVQKNLHLQTKNEEFIPKNRKLLKLLLIPTALIAYLTCKPDFSKVENPRESLVAVNTVLEQKEETSATTVLTTTEYKASISRQLQEPAKNIQSVNSQENSIPAIRFGVIGDKKIREVSNEEKHTIIIAIKKAGLDGHFFRDRIYERTIQLMENQNYTAEKALLLAADQRGVDVSGDLGMQIKRAIKHVSTRKQKASFLNRIANRIGFRSEVQA
ncbi:MAG: hypothetical protein PHU71_03590 [Candidatus Gracilibacteria bacterium]|nr:hypothetical protein [Candidatus Gracilibacteria bacterium]